MVQKLKNNRMKIYRYPTKDTWKDLVKRPVLEQKEISELIAEIFAEVKKTEIKL